MSSKDLLNYCPNYKEIIDFKDKSSDVITLKLISIYQDFVFKANLNDSKDIKMIKEFDYVLNKYRVDYLFRKELKSEIINVKIKKSCQDVLRAIVESVLNIFNNYLFNTTRKIKIARWI